MRIAYTEKRYMGFMKYALEKIEKVAETGATELDLSKLTLVELPLEILQLVNLTSLDLSGNQLTSLPAEIGQLVNLTSLELSNNQLTTLPPEIGKLINLEVLLIQQPVWDSATLTNYDEFD